MNEDCLHCEYCDEEVSSISMTTCPDCKAMFCSQDCLTRHFADIIGDEFKLIAKYQEQEKC